MIDLSLLRDPPNQAASRIMSALGIAVFTIVMYGQEEDHLKIRECERPPSLPHAQTPWSLCIEELPPLLQLKKELARKDFCDRISNLLP